MQNVSSLKWEAVSSVEDPGGYEQVERAKIPGGWLVAVVYRPDNDLAVTRALTFVPDPPNAFVVSTTPEKT